MSRARSSRTAGIGTEQRGGHEAEVRQRRIPAADSRHSRKDRPKAFLLRDLLELRSGIGRQHEVTPGVGLAELLHGSMKKMLLENIHFERRARLRRHEEQRPPEIDRALNRTDLSGIGRIDDVQSRIPVRAADDRAHHFGREARAAHAEQHDVGHTLRL